jgi:hypothetical protein
MLRTSTPKLTGVEIADIDAEESGPIRLAGPGHVAVETIYDNWFRLTDAAATFTVADPAVVAFDPARHELRPLAAGRTTITSSYAGRQLVQQIEVPASEPPLPCVATTRPVVVDGDLAEWPALTYKVDAPLNRADAPAWTGPADLAYRFAVAHDAQFLYIAIQTTDDVLKSDPVKDPWFQDGVEVRIDARPAAQRMFVPGEREGDNLLLVALSPAPAGETRPLYKVEKVPKGTKVVCLATPSGHNTEIAIPVAYLNQKAGKDWTDVRINIAVDDLDNDPRGSRGDKFWWKPDWRTVENLRGSGAFERQPAPRQ